MVIATVAAFQRFRWLLVAAILSFIVILLSLSTDWRGKLLIPSGTHSDYSSSDRSALSVPLRILPVGDSITQGQWANGHNGYRLELRNLLAQQGRSVDFIGSKSLGIDNDDNQHEGWGGMVMCVIQEKIMADGILTMHPNLVLLQAGTNDNNEAFNIPPVEPHESQIIRLENLMNAVFCEIPDTTLIVAQITDNQFGSYNTARVRQFNSEIPPLVAKKRAQGFKISIVDQFTAVGSSLDEIGLHPSEEGYNKMAKAWFEGIDSLPSAWLQPAREPQSKAPWSWYMQQKTACDALKGWKRDTYITDKAIGNATYPPHMDMGNWTRIHDL